MRLGRALELIRQQLKFERMRFPLPDGRPTAHAVTPSQVLAPDSIADEETEPTATVLPHTPTMAEIRRRQRQRGGLPVENLGACEGCGCDLIAHDLRCPECGLTTLYGHDRGEG